jgi:peptidoglycan hydrolase-like protein with peptidoglycan-binding domain
MRNLTLATASVIALGVGGAGIAHAAATSNAPGSNMPDLSGTAQSSQNAVSVSENEILQAQQQLRAQGFYNGPIDGLLDTKTKQALERYQRENGLNETATLDQATLHSLLENTGRSGSSTPPNSNRAATDPRPEALGSSRPGGSMAPY